MNEEIIKLYDVLKREGYYTKSLDEFKGKWADESYKKKVYNVVKRDNLYTKDYNSFISKYSLGQETSKKKEPTVLPSVQKVQPISSGTQPKGNQKPLGTSVSKKDKDREGFYTLESKDVKVYTGLPGKEKTQYRVLNNKWQRRDESGWRDLDSQNSIDLLNKYFNKTVKSREDITRGLESNVKKTEVEKELSDKELASVLGWSEQEVKKSKAGSGSPDKDFKAAMVKPDMVKPSESNAIGTMAVSTQKAYSDLGPSASSEEIKKKTKYYDTVESQKYLKSIGYDIDVNGDESDEKTKIALNKEKVKQDVITKDAFKAADTYESIDNEINQDLLLNDEEFVVTELRKKYSKDGFYFEETGAGDSMIVKYSPIEGVETRQIEIPLNTNDINNVNALKDFMKQSYMTASERKNLNSEELDIRTQEGRDAHIDKLLKLMADNPYKYGSSLLSEDEIENHINNSYSNLKEQSKNLQQEYKELQYRIDKFNQNPSNPQEKAFINNKIHELSQKELQINNRYNDLSSVDKSINKIASINYNKSKEPGNWIGVLGSQFIQGITNPEKALTQISMDVLPYALEILPYSAEENIVDPMTRQKLKDQGYTDIQILDYASKELKNNLYENLKEGITNVSSLGTTTSDYVNSKDRNDLLKAASFLAESIGTSLSAGGNPTLQKVAFFTQSYNSMEEQMVGPEFESLNEWQKKLISVPYGFVIGALERYGIAALGEGANPVVNRFATAIVNRTMLSLPKDATVDTIKREINKNVGAMIAQGALKVVGGSLVEGGTEATQQLFEIGEKFLVNKIVGSDKEPGFEYFKDVPDITTADGLKKAFKIAGTDFYYGALGGLLMSGGVNAYQTTKQNSFNKKTDQEFEAFYDSMTDDKLRKLNVLNTKIKLKNGEITKEEAKETIDAINSSSQKLKSLNPNLSIRDKKDAFNLMLQRDKLEQEKAPLDEAMQAPYNERITNINNELKTISENAVKESTKPVEEVTAEGGGVQYQGAQEGQPEVGKTERPVRQAAQPSPDLGDRAVEGGRTEEARVTRQVVNRPAVLSEFGGKTFDTPLKGDVYVEGQQVVFEDRATGRIYELGNVDEVMDSSVPGLQAQEETVSITPEGKVSIEGNNWNIQSELPTQGIEYNPAGEVTRVSLKDDTGNTQMFEGQQAVDIAYQIELQKIQSTEQQQFINDLLEQDEEFQTATESIKPRQIEAVVQEEAAPDIVPTEPTVAEETVVEQPIVEEVERLGKLLEGTDEQINEQVGKLKVSKDNNKVAQSIANAAKSIAKILPDVKFVVHDTDESYRKATGEQGRSQSSAGEYNPKTKTININASKANNRTAAHEAFHAVILNGVKNDVEAARLTKAMIDAVRKSLVNVDGAGEIISYLNDFASNYEENIQNEEKLAELFAILSDNYATLPAPAQSLIRRFLDRIAKMFGLKPLTDREVIDFMNAVSQKVAHGEEIQAREIIGISRSKIKELNSRFQADFSDAVSKLTFVFDKNGDRFKKLEKDGFITRDKSLSDFNGKYIFLHQPDAAFSGMIFKDGEVLVEGKGGVFYPIKFHEDGYFWASTDRTAKKMADDLNKVMEQNGGTIYMALTSAPSDKLMSSTTMANAILDLFSSKALDKNFKVTPTQLKSALRKAANDVKSVNNKKVGLDLKLPATATIEEMQSAIRTALGSENSSFADRKNFAVELTKLMAGEINKNDVAVNQFGKLFSEGIQNKYFKGITKTGKLKISAANMTQALSEMFTEPMLKEGIDREKGGQVYAILELNGPVKAEPSTKHESYPMAIESANKDNKVTLHVLKDRQNWFDTFEDFETGDIVSKERQLKVYPTSGVSVKGLKVNTANVTTQKQLVAPNGKPSNLNEKQWNQVRTPEFKKWFGDWENDPKNASKVVDENGEPLVVYHGTRKSFDEFSYDVKPANFRAGSLEYSFWFTANKKNSELYGDQVMEVFLNSRNPIEIDYTNPESYREVVVPADKIRAMSIAEFNEKKGNIKHSQMKKGIELRMSEDKTIDGIIHKNIKDIILSDNFQVFNPTQVKSATENVGTFSELDKSIRKQKADTISGIVFTARQNGFSDAAIQQYLSQQGYSQQQITNAMASVNPSGVTIDDVFNKSQEELESKLKSRSVKQRVTDMFRRTRETLLNRQTDIKRALRGIKNTEAKQAYAKLVDKAGASGFAGLRFKILSKKIYGKLKESEIKALDSIIYARRVISINENRRKINIDIYEGLTPDMANELDIIITAIRNKSKNDLADAKKRLGDKKYEDLINRAKKYRKPYTGISIEVEVTDANGNIVKEKRSYNESDAQRDLVDKRAELGDERFNEINRRADIYFGVFEENLKKLKDSGRINEETYNNLKDVEYSPIKTIKYIIKDNYDPNDLDKEAARLGISKQDIMSLGDENENGIITDSRWLLMMNLNMLESRVFENQMLNELVSAIENATTQEKIALSDYFILDNPIIGQFKDGRPKRKFDDQTLPDGYTRVHYFKDGIDNYIIAKEAIAKQILDVKNSKIAPAIEQFNEDVPILGWLVKQLTLAPSRLLRFFATGGNPYFILGNVPIDWANAVFFNEVYSHKWYEQFKVIAGVKAAWGFVKNFTKSAISKGEWNKIYMEYAEHGGLMETMSQEGLRALQEMKSTGRLAKKLPGALSPIFKSVVGAPYKLLEGYGKAMSYLGETSEIAMRLAVYEKMKSNLIDDFKKENGVNPTGKQLDDIMWESSREARELIDFNQGGSWSKEIDVFMPYFNASMQGLRKPLDYARENPIGFASSIIQLALMGGSIAIYSVASGLSAFGGDDEEDKKKKMKKALDSINAREKANYHIIFTGNIDKDGELEYIRIKKLPIASIITTDAESVIYNYFLGYNNKEAQEFADESAVPLWPSEIISRNPLIAGIYTYAENKDAYTGEKVFKEPRNKKILPTAEGIFDDKVEGIYKALAPSLGLSPARSKAFVEKFITNESTNPTINIIYAAANGIFDKGTTFGDEFSLMTEELLKHSERKFIRTTNKDIIQFKIQDEFEKREMNKETELYLKEQEMYKDIKRIYEKGDNLTVDEIIEKVKDKFDPIDQKRYIQKYYAYTQNMNIDKSLLDIVYESNPEVQAMRLYDRYGKIMTRDEINEIGKVLANAGQKFDNKAIYFYQKNYGGVLK